MVDFAGSNVVVTGGSGALGRAVIGALRAAGAVCHVPNLVAAELDEFPYASDPGVHIARGVDLAEEAAVRGFYQALPPLWASIHLAAASSGFIPLSIQPMIWASSLFGMCIPVPGCIIPRSKLTRFEWIA